MAIIEQQLDGVDWLNFEDEVQLTENFTNAHVSEFTHEDSNNPNINVHSRLWQHKLSKRLIKGMAIAAVVLPTIQVVGDYYVTRFSEEGATTGAHQFTKTVMQDIKRETPRLSKDAVQQVSEDASQLWPRFLAKDLTPIAEKKYHLDLDHDGVIGQPHRKHRVSAPKVKRF